MLKLPIATKKRSRLLWYYKYHKGQQKNHVEKEIIIYSPVKNHVEKHISAIAIKRKTSSKRAWRKHEKQRNQKIFYKLVTQTPKKKQTNHSHYEKETYLEPIIPYR
jgi:hypothetical protein